MNEIILFFTNLINKYTGLSASISKNTTITIFLILIWKILHYLFNKYFIPKIGDLSRRYIATKSFTYIFRFIVIIILFKTWIGVGSGIWAYFGLLSAGIAVALQDSIKNFAGWIFIMTSKPFSTGDRIEIDKHAGDVVDIRINQTTILEIGNWIKAEQSTGRVIHIPNGWFLQKSISNYTQKFNLIWNEIPVTITFESNWEKARNILIKIINEKTFIKEEDAKNRIHQAADSYLIYYSKLTPYVWLSVENSGVVLTLRYLCEARKRRFSTEQIWINILTEFKKHNDIDLAYPTQRIFYNPIESKNTTTIPQQNKSFVD